MMGYYYGGCSTDLLSEQLGYLLAARDCDAICLDIDSPGGSSYGLEEFAEELYQARATKPIYAVANCLAASAAYWIGCQAANFYCSPSGDVGSVGVYLLHADLSAALEKEGVQITIVKAGKYKDMATPFKPLSAEDAGYLQELVDATYATFIQAVARGRGKTPAEVRSATFGQGRIVPCDQAVTAGMVDKAMSYGDLLEKLGGVPAMPGRTRAEVLRLRHEQAKRLAEAVTGKPAQEAIHPDEDEDEEDFMDRCMDSGYSADQCEVFWDRAQAKGAKQ
jgi:signal peptide peptidase SppA